MIDQLYELASSYVDDFRLSSSVSSPYYSTEEEKKLFKELLAFAESGQEESYEVVAKSYEIGKGCEQNDEKAIYWYEKCEKYYQASKIAKEEKKVELLLKCENESEKFSKNLGKILRQLGDIFLEGRYGVIKDEERGINYLIRASDLNDFKSSDYLRYIYKEKNDEEKFKFYLKRAAEGGLPFAMSKYCKKFFETETEYCFNLMKPFADKVNRRADSNNPSFIVGKCYYLGVGGVSQNFKKAIKYFDITIKGSQRSNKYEKMIEFYESFNEFSLASYYVHKKNKSISKSIYVLEHNPPIEQLKSLYPIKDTTSLNEQGESILHLVNLNRSDIIDSWKILLKNGADPFIKNSKGITAFDSLSEELKSELEFDVMKQTSLQNDLFNSIEKFSNSQVHGIKYNSFFVSKRIGISEDSLNYYIKGMDTESTKELILWAYTGRGNKEIIQKIAQRFYKKLLPGKFELINSLKKNFFLKRNDTGDIDLGFNIGKAHSFIIGARSKYISENLNSLIELPELIIEFLYTDSFISKINEELANQLYNLTDTLELNEFSNLSSVIDHCLQEEEN